MILVTGARGVVGAPLCQRLLADGVSFTPVSRSQNGEGLQWDLEQALSADQLSELDTVRSLIHTAPIWLLPKHLPLLASAGLKRIVAFSSTSVLSKQSSPDSKEQKLVQSLRDAEQQLMDDCGKHDINLTILRPSMIYGYASDENVSRIARFIQRWKCMLLVGKASGQRQPVHADDLVGASLAVLAETKTIGQIYNLAGKDILSYRQMVETVFVALQLKPRIVSLPLVLYRLGLSLASRFGSFDYTPEMANRMNQDLIYNITAAKIDFGFDPQGFLQNPQRDLPMGGELKQ